MPPIESAPGSYQLVTTESDLVDWEATQVGFGPGEVFTLTDMIYGMMVPSGNDAARAVARALGAQDGDSSEQAMARFTTPDQIGATAVFLCSEGAATITGSSISVDGGWVAQ